MTMLALRDANGKLFSKNILDIDMDMSVVENDNEFGVKVSRNYTLNEKFDNLEDAEEKILELTASRNSEETLNNEV